MERICFERMFLFARQSPFFFLREKVNVYCCEKKQLNGVVVVVWLGNNRHNWRLCASAMPETRCKQWGIIFEKAGRRNNETVNDETRCHVIWNNVDSDHWTDFISVFLYKTPDDGNGVHFWTFMSDLQALLRAPPSRQSSPLWFGRTGERSESTSSRRQSLFGSYP